MSAPEAPEAEAAALEAPVQDRQETTKTNGDGELPHHDSTTRDHHGDDAESNIVVKSERDDVADEPTIEPPSGIKRQESDSQDASSASEKNRKRKRAASPPWQFPIAHESTMKTDDGRRVSARFNANSTPASSTPAPSERDGHTRNRSTSQSASRSRQPSPPWKSFKAEGPTSISVDGVRKSGRVNRELTQPAQPKRVSPRTKKTVDKVKNAAETKPKPAPRGKQPPQPDGPTETPRRPSQRKGRAQSPSSKIAELQAQIAALKPTRSFESPGVGNEPTTHKRKRSSDAAKGTSKPESPSSNRRSMRRRSEALTPEPSRSMPRLKLRFSAQKAFVAPTHPNAIMSPPARPPRPSIYQLLEPLDLKEMQIPYQENERGPPTLEWFQEKNERQATEEGAMRQRILEAAQPNGVLSEQMCSLFQDEQQREPPKPHGLVDHLTAHALNLRSLQIKEKVQHRQLAKKLAYEALEYWRAMRGPTEEDLIAEQDKTYRLIYKQVVFDMRSKWEMVQKHVEGRRKEKWEREEEERRQERLQKQLEHAEAMVKQQREAGDEDTSEMDLEDIDGSDIAGSETGDEDEVEESGEDNMSSSESEGGEESGDALEGDALEAYKASREAEPPDKSDDEDQIENEDDDMPGTTHDPPINSDVPMTDAQDQGPANNGKNDSEDTGVRQPKSDAAATPDPSTQLEDNATSVSPRTSKRSRHSPGLEAPTETDPNDGDDNLSDDESTDMYDSDEDMSSTGPEDNRDDDEDSGDESESGEEGGESSADEGALGSSMLGMLFGKKQIRGFGLPTPTTSAEGDAKDRERTVEAADGAEAVRDETAANKDSQAEAGASESEHAVVEGSHVPPVGEPANKEQEVAKLPEPVDVDKVEQDKLPEPMHDEHEGEHNQSEAPEPVDEVVPASAHRSPSEASALDPASKQLVPLPQLLRGTLRSYQHAGLDWLASLHRNGTNGILADEMGLGKTIQTIALLAHLAEQQGVWETHLIIVPTSVILNWVTEFQKFLPGFRVLGYYGSSEERQYKRKGWVNDPHLEDRSKRGYNVVITSYNVAMQDINAIRNVQWHYLVLDEAHNIRNFNSQRWQVLIRLKTRARLLLTGTPLQNSLTELWSLLTFLTAGDDDPAHGDLEEFLSHWKEPVNEIFDRGVTQLSTEAQKVVDQLHVSLRPFLLRRLKSEVEKDLPKKTESVVVCKLSKRQRQLYQEYMGLASTRESLTKGNAVSAGKVLLSLRRVCNHPDLFDPRPIQTSFAMEKSAVEDFTVKEEVVRKLLGQPNETPAGLLLAAREVRRTSVIKRSRQLHAAGRLRKEAAEIQTSLQQQQPPDISSFSGSMAFQRVRQHEKKLQHLRDAIATSEASLRDTPVYGSDLREAVTIRRPKPYYFTLRGQVPMSFLHAWPAFGRRPLRLEHLSDWHLIHSTALQQDLLTPDKFAENLQPIITRFTFCTPVTTAPILDCALPSRHQQLLRASEAYPISTDFAHEARARTSIVFPDSRLLVYDSGKLQRLSKLLRDLQSRGSRSLIFTQMTGTLNILEQFLNLLGLPYLRLDGSTPVERRQLYSAEFNRPDSKYACMILSSRAGGVGLNLVGASSVIFYDLDWNPQMDRQCMDRAHRIGQVRDVEVYKMVSEKTVEENILRRANQKSLLDQTVIQEGHFTTEYSKAATEVAKHGEGVDEDEVAAAIERYLGGGEKATNQAIESVEDREDVAAAHKAQKEEHQDDVDFAERSSKGASAAATPGPAGLDEEGEENEDRKGHVDGYMVNWMEEMLKDVPFVPPVVRKLDKHGRDPSHRPKRKR
ncbi:hypothetical protein KC340_g10767 [Hortaea werneckii]|nr:hypothetical protein KC342_g10916 [Hortaea werneckii]KAI7309417.1 hypothetical protein KC340_g10767 [Hortaea werneckii]KAI7384527.1 hypothetical protein KC328_g10760 [Hortaea werneckii]